MTVSGQKYELSASGWTRLTTADAATFTVQCVEGTAWIAVSDSSGPGDGRREGDLMFVEGVGEINVSPVEVNPGSGSAEVWGRAKSMSATVIFSSVDAA